MNSQIEEKNRNRARCVGKGVGLLPSLGMPPSRNLHVLNCVKLNPVFFGFLWKLHYIGILECIIGHCWSAEHSHGGKWKA